VNDASNTLLQLVKGGLVISHTRTHLKKRILVQDVGGAGFQTAGILQYVEDLETGTNTQIGPKDFCRWVLKKSIPNAPGCVYAVKFVNFGEKEPARDRPSPKSGPRLITPKRSKS
jgi:hypothetical protein